MDGPAAAELAALTIDPRLARSEAAVIIWSRPALTYDMSNRLPDWDRLPAAPTSYENQTLTPHRKLKLISNEMTSAPPYGCRLRPAGLTFPTGPVGRADAPGWLRQVAGGPRSGSGNGFTLVRLVSARVSADRISVPNRADGALWTRNRLGRSGIWPRRRSEAYCSGCPAPGLRLDGHTTSAHQGASGPILGERLFRPPTRLRAGDTPDRGERMDHDR